MKVAELPARALAERLGRGLDLDTGPFVIRIETPITTLAEEVRALYGEFPLDEGGGLADFHVTVLRPAGPLGIRRWWRRQASVLLDEDRPFEPLPVDMAVPMLEWSINWCAATRANQYVMIHAAVLELGGRALILPGVTGAGKSTLCAGLAHRGWRLLSDEFALIRPGGLFVLMSRAGVVDFEALLSAAESGRLKVATDVFPEEPFPNDHRIRELPNNPARLAAHQLQGRTTGDRQTPQKQAGSCVLGVA